MNHFLLIKIRYPCTPSSTLAQRSLVSYRKQQSLFHFITFYSLRSTHELTSLSSNPRRLQIIHTAKDRRDFEDRK
ncbi:hypothetical protein EYC84_002532 [Monilinia fructicola]|uniref:Uncharacterized protein n=1 Tax=Monilinia fructicola TaxID=38448 RepID=A0A5M9JTM4_MONFR|nr:hypothetical protein EYC84_002532 [Monilinia fructicola]